MKDEITEVNIKRGLTKAFGTGIIPYFSLTGAEVCLFCNKPEKSYTPDKDVEFVCGTCVSLLASADQEDMKRAYKKALDHGYLRKASALESFIIPEVKNGERPSRSVTRNIDGKRIARTVRS